jgi:hypothetical protein
MELIPDGYTRVSDVLAIFQAYAFVDRVKLRRAVEIGTDVHEAIEAYWNEGFVPLDRKKSPYFESFLKWVDGKNIVPNQVETRLYDHARKLTGKPDLIATIDGMLVLVDFKTGSWAHPEIWRLQATFYRSMINRDDICPDLFLFLQLKKDGSAPVEYPMGYRHEDWETCKAALQCFEYFRKMKNP